MIAVTSVDQMAYLTALRSALTYDQPFERLLQYFSDLTTTEKGRQWEQFCLHFLEVNGYEVWSLSSLPIDIREQLNLASHDMGIDLVARKEGQYYAIQCKYRNRSARGRRTVVVPGKITNNNGVSSLGLPRQVKIASNQVSWRELSTFYALCARTGPWAQQIVMTTADSVRRQGVRTGQDKTYAYRGFCGQDRSVWLAMVGSIGHQCGAINDGDARPATTADLRARRLNFYNKKIVGS